MSFCSRLGPKNVTLVTSSFIYFSIIMTNRNFFTFKLDESVLHGRAASARGIFCHQVVKAKKYNFLLVLQVFVGLSFPFEGPAPLEALANGCVFLNPRLNPPQSRLNSEFFKEKPNIREVRDGLWYNTGLFWIPWTMHFCIMVDYGVISY